MSDTHLDFPDHPTVGQEFGRWLWTGRIWQLRAAAPRIEEAPNDGRHYGRINLAWGEVLGIEGGTLTGDLRIRANGTGTLFLGSGDHSLSWNGTNYLAGTNTIWHSGNLNPSSFATQTWVTNSFATQTWVNGRGFLTASALNGYATQAWVTANFSAPTGGATTTWVSANFATISWVQQQINSLQAQINSIASGGAMDGRYVIKPEAYGLGQLAWAGNRNWFVGAERCFWGYNPGHGTGNWAGWADRSDVLWLGSQ